MSLKIKNIIENKVFYVGILIFLTFSNLIGWGFQLFQICSAIFLDCSASVGYPENSGVVIIAYNVLGELTLELFMVIFIICITFFSILYLNLRRKMEKRADEK